MTNMVTTRRVSPLSCVPKQAQRKRIEKKRKKALFMEETGFT